jgi:hypothetical protein
VLESFAQLGFDVDFDKLVEQAEAISDPISEMQSECGETTELSFPTPYSSIVESPDFYFESKWVGPIHVWPRWRSATMRSRKDNEWFFARVQIGYPPFFNQFMKWLARCPYFCVLDSYSSNDHYPFDLGKSEHTILIVIFDVLAFSLSQIVWIMKHTCCR